MRTPPDTAQPGARPQPGVVATIGNFDGVHVGHAALLRAAAACADRLAASGPRPPTLALMFWPHPSATLDAARAPATLMSRERRESLLRSLGADDVAVIEPTRDLLSRSPEEFLSHLARERGVRAIVEGPDFRFGKGRAGDVDTLRAAGATLGFETIIVEPVTAPMTDMTIAPVSSSLVRWLLERGRVRDAAACLGRPHELEGVVVRGARRGRELGMPTANIDCATLAPADGVYAALATRPDGEVWPAAVSVGTNPQFDGVVRSVEAHLIGWNGRLDDYGWRLELRLVSWLRDQAKFESVDALIEQMRRDCDRALQAVGRAAGAPTRAGAKAMEGAIA